MQPPSSLTDLQKRFGKILLGKLPLGSLEPKERMEIYYFGYRIKIEEILRRQFPALSSLLSEVDFRERVALPYGKKFPPKDWHLETFGIGLYEWLKKEGLASLSPLLLPVAEIDEAFLKCNYAEKKEAFLIPELQVVESLYPIIEIRKSLIDNSPRPIIEKKKRMFVVYCNSEGKLFSREVDLVEGKILKLLSRYTLDKALELLVLDRTLPLNSLEKELPIWSSTWAKLEWIQEK